MKKKKIFVKKQEQFEIHKDYALFCHDYCKFIDEIEKGNYGLDPMLFESFKMTAFNFAFFENRIALSLGIKPLIDIKAE